MNSELHHQLLTHVEKNCVFETEMGEVQISLNKILSSKPFRFVNFASRFVLLIKFKFKIRTFNNYYESRCKINGCEKF
jgi:hypothetical protein